MVIAGACVVGGRGSHTPLPPKAPITDICVVTHSGLKVTLTWNRNKNT